MPARKDSIELARNLRRRQSPPEALLWRALRGRRLDGLKFRRRHPIGPYVLDFFCAAARLAIEVDGRSHEHPDQGRYDDRRELWLSNQGVRVLRLPARYVLEDLDGAAAMVAQAARNPRPAGGDA